MKAKKKLEFKIGEIVVYPKHGVGEITKIENMEISNIKTSFYVVKMEQSKLIIRVPLDKKEEVGLRKISSKKVIAYLAPKFSITDWKKYDAARKNLKIKNEVLVKPRQANYFKVKAGQFFRINITTGSQVGDLNLFNLRNLNENFFSGKTRALYGTHLSTKDRLWSCFPYFRPMATITHDTLDWYGYENKTEDKIEGIGSYKYHLVLENNLLPNTMTEKLFDSYLGNSYPIYSGATNAEDYFPSNSFARINMHDFNGSINVIKDCISNNYYEANYEKLLEARKIVLEKFNLIKRIDVIVEERLNKPSVNNLKIDSVIYPKFHFEGKNKLSRIIFSINQRFKKLTNYLEKFYS